MGWGRARGDGRMQAVSWEPYADAGPGLRDGQLLAVYEAVLDAFDVSRATRVLDVACGHGLFLRLAANRGAAVAGVDADFERLEVALARTPDADLHRGAPESLPFPGESFDLVTGFGAFELAARPVDALREAARVVHEGGGIVVGAWVDGEPDDALAIGRALAPLLPPGAPRPFTTRRALQALVRRARLTPVGTADVVCRWSYRDVAAAVAGEAATAPAALACAHSGRHEVLAALDRALRPFGRPGTVRLGGVFHYTVATR